MTNKTAQQKIPRGYKETKIGLIPKDWNCVRLDDMGSLSKGAGISKSEVQENGFPAVRYGELYTCYDTQINRVHSFINETSASNSKVINCGDILFAGSGETIDEIGKSAVYLGNDKAYAGGDIIIFSPKNRDSLCLAYLLNGQIVRRELRRLGQGQSVVHIYKSDISKLYLPIPPLPQQKKISKILSEWDSAILNIEKLISAKRKFKKALMQQLLTGKRRFKEFKNQPWKEYHLDDLFKERKEAGREDLPLLAITSDRGVIYREEVDRKDSSSDDKSKYKNIMPGDIGYNTMRMWQGVSALSTIEGIVSPAYTICVPYENMIDGLFASCFFKYPPIVHLFYRYSQGLVSDTWNLKFPNFAQIKVAVPSLEEQKQIASVLTDYDKDIGLLNQHLELLKQQKRGLMQKLLTGKIRVKV